MIEKIIVKRVLSKENAAKLKTKFLTEKHYNKLITQDTDAYDNFGNLLFRFRKNAIPFDILKSGVDAFESSIELTESRGSASGKLHLQGITLKNLKKVSHLCSL